MVVQIFFRDRRFQDYINGHKRIPYPTDAYSTSTSVNHSFTCFIRVKLHCH